VRIRDITEVKIKLRGFDANSGTNGDPDAFIADLKSQGQEHPFDHNAIMFGPVRVHVSTSNSGIHLHDITSLSKSGQGNATKVLNLLTKLADKHSVPIEGEAIAYSNQPEHIRSNKRLAQWYQTNGFKITNTIDDGTDEDDDQYEIEYMPRRNS
jgi:hypothetical protein